MSDNPELDKLLRGFLEHQAEERAAGITLESLHRAVGAIANARLKDQQILAHALSEIREELREKIKAVEEKQSDLQDQHNAMEATQTRYGRRIKSLESAVKQVTQATPQVQDWEPDPREITGTFAFAEIMRDHQERKSDHKWLKRKGIEWVGAGFGALVLIILTAIVSVLTTKLTQASPTEQHPTPPTPAPAPAHAK